MFSGCGGFDIGAKLAGGQCLSASDLDADCVATFREHVSEDVVVHDLNFGLPKFTAGRARLDLVIAGPPCQGFSTLGPQRGKDRRNSLLPLAGRLAASLGPTAIVIENVVGVLAPKFSASVRQLEDALSTAGYGIQRVVLSANDAGLPQRRKRVFFVAFRGGRTPRLEIERRTATSLAEVLDVKRGAPNHVQRPLSANSLHGQLSRHIEQGKKLSNARGGAASVHTWDIPEVFGAVSRGERELLETLLRERRRERQREFGDADPVNASRLARRLARPVRDDITTRSEKGYVRPKGDGFDLTHTYNGKYRRPLLAGMAPAVDTRFGDPSLVLHPTEHRGFTVREAARIQGFPDEFIFRGSERAQFMMVGNAVPPPLGHSLLTAVQQHL
jgi:DNA (cytosine-5)-methyltransferase 1